LAHDVTFIHPDGTGPELTEATRRVLEATGVASDRDRHEAGTEAAVFEATHGSSLSYAGKNRMSPTALMLPGVYMLDHLNETTAARALQNAIAAVIRRATRSPTTSKPAVQTPPPSARASSPTP